MYVCNEGELGLGTDKILELKKGGCVNLRQV